MESQAPVCHYKDAEQGKIAFFQEYTGSFDLPPALACLIVANAGFGNTIRNLRRPDSWAIDRISPG
jgi:hypothetical protein